MRTKGRKKISTGIYFVSLCIYTCILVEGGGGAGAGILILLGTTSSRVVTLEVITVS